MSLQVLLWSAFQSMKNQIKEKKKRVANNTQYIASYNGPQQPEREQQSAQKHFSVRR